jgi:outer membrane receptor protein involved in Fe transport
LVFDIYYLATPGGVDNPPGVQHPIYDESRSMVNAAVTYKLNARFKARLAAENLFENDVPPPTFNMDSPQSGHVGYDARRVYLTLTSQF